MMPEGEALASAREALAQATRAARTAARSSLAAGMSEVEAARQYGVTRMTIRAWRKEAPDPIATGRGQEPTIKEST
jgi:transposase-like protein